MKRIILLLILLLNNYINPQNFSIKNMNIIEYYPILLKNYTFEEQKAIYFTNKNICNIKELNIQKIKLKINNFYFKGNFLNYKIYAEILINIFYNFSIYRKIILTPILSTYSQKFSGFYTSHTFLPAININYNSKRIYLNFYINKTNFNTGILFYNKYFSSAISFNQSLEGTNEDLRYFSLININDNLKLSISYLIKQKSLEITWYIKLKKYFFNFQIKYHPYLSENKLIEIGRIL